LRGNVRDIRARARVLRFWKKLLTRYAKDAG